MKFVTSNNTKILFVAISFLTMFLGTVSAKPVLKSSSKVHVVGDSTVASQCGWGNHLQAALKNKYTVTNYARGGRSSKSFYNQGLWKHVLKALHPGDYVLIQFGHNDWWQKKKPDVYAAAETDYKKYLSRYIKESRGKKAIPILVTPVARCIFIDGGKVRCPNPEYPEAMRNLASELGVRLIDLDFKSRMFLEKLGHKEAKKLYKIYSPGESKKYPKGKKDWTHTRQNGAIAYAKIVADSFNKVISTPVSINKKIKTKVNKAVVDMKDLNNFSFDPRGLALKSSANVVARVSCKDSKHIAITAGNYNLTFSAAHSWTLRSVYFRNQVIDQALPGAFLQTVINESHGQVENGKRVDPFLGSGHRPEHIYYLAVAILKGTKTVAVRELFSQQKGLKLKATKNGRKITLIKPFELDEAGNIVIIKKKSKFLSPCNGLLIYLEFNTVISPSGIEQYVRITGGEGNLKKIKFMFPLMHMLPKATFEYLTYNGSHLVEKGKFKDDKSFSLKKSITSLITWVPKSETGIYIYHTSSYPGGKVNIWNRPLDNKIYFKYPHPKLSGVIMDYSLFFEAFPCKGIAIAPQKGLWKKHIFPSGKESIKIYVKQ